MSSSGLSPLLKLSTSDKRLGPEQQDFYSDCHVCFLKQMECEDSQSSRVMVIQKKWTLSSWNTFQTQFRIEKVL